MAGIWTEVTALGQILLIDITLAGDNAVVVGLAASTVPKQKRQQVIIGGIAVAVLLRLALAAMARQLLTIVGLTLSGGILLLWVAWKLFRQIRSRRSQPDPARAPQSVGKAIVHVAVADLSMSLDNVLAVAGAATGHPGWVLAGGLGLAVILMAVRIQPRREAFAPAAVDFVSRARHRRVRRKPDDLDRQRRGHAQLVACLIANRFFAFAIAISARKR